MLQKIHAVRTFPVSAAHICFYDCLFSTAASRRFGSEAFRRLAEAPAINSVRLSVLDADTNAILFDANMDEQRYPASITKVMTALLVAENNSMPIRSRLENRPSANPFREMPESTFSLEKRSA